MVKAWLDADRGSMDDLTANNLNGTFSFIQAATGLPGSANTGNGLAAFLLGYVSQYSVDEPPPLKRYSWYWDAFVQDDWKVTPRLILNLGVSRKWTPP